MNVTFGWLDVVVALILIIFGIRGYRRGLSGEVLQIVGLLASFILAYQFFQVIGTIIVEHSSIPVQIADISGYVIIFISINLLFFIIRKIVHKLMTFSFVAVLEKGGGIAAGVVRAICMISIIYVLIGMLHIPHLTGYIIERSFTGRYIITISPHIYNGLFSIWKPAKRFDSQDYFSTIQADLQPKMH